MKTLLLMRHAKSSWKDPTLADHDRPLNARGREAAPRMARWLATKGPRPALILSSTALRARDTALAVMAAFDPAPPLCLEAGLYHAEPPALRARLCALDQAVDCVLLVGHNPGLEALLTELLGRPERLTTANVAWLELAVERWADLDRPASAPTLKALWRPRELD